MSEEIRIIVIGDSISVGMYGYGLRAPFKVAGAPIMKSHKGRSLVVSHENTPASYSGQYISWVKDKFKNQLDSLSMVLSARQERERRLLIVSVATNDATVASLCAARKAKAGKEVCNSWSLKKNIENTKKDIAEIIRLGKSHGFEIAIMDLIKYNGKRTDPVFLEKHEEFRNEYNSAISQYSFDSNVPMYHKNIHPNPAGSRQLISNALKKLDASPEIHGHKFSFPAPNFAGFIAPGVLPRSQKQDNRRKVIHVKPKSTKSKSKIQINKKFKPNTSGNCKENIACRCVTRSTPATVLAIQTALQNLAKKNNQPDPLPVHGTDGLCGPETRKAIMKFQSDNNLVLCDGCVGPETYPALNKALGVDIKTYGSKPRTPSRAKLVSGSGYTLEDLKEKAKLLGVHPDLLVFAAMLSSEPGTRDGENSRFAIFNTVVNRIGSNSNSQWSRSATSESVAWNVIVGYASTLGSQGTQGRQYASSKFPSGKPALTRAIEEVISFCERRLNEPNTNTATNFFHQGAQGIFWKKTVKEMLKDHPNRTEEELYSIREKWTLSPKGSSARAAARAKWRSLSKITKNRMIREVGKYWKGSATKTSHWPKELVYKWRGFDYGAAPAMVAKKWERSVGAEQKIANQNPRSTLRVFGDRYKIDESFVKDYLNQIIKEQPVDIQAQASLN